MQTGYRGNLSTYHILKPPEVYDFIHVFTCNGSLETKLLNGLSFSKEIVTKEGKILKRRHFYK